MGCLTDSDFEKVDYLLTDLCHADGTEQTRIIREINEALKTLPHVPPTRESVPMYIPEFFSLNPGGWRDDEYYRLLRMGIYKK